MHPFLVKTSNDGFHLFSIRISTTFTKCSHLTDQGSESEIQFFKRLSGTLLEVLKPKFQHFELVLLCLFRTGTQILYHLPCFLCRLCTPQLTLNRVWSGTYDDVSGLSIKTKPLGFFRSPFTPVFGLSDNNNLVLFRRSGCIVVCPWTRGTDNLYLDGTIIDDSHHLITDSF